MEETTQASLSNPQPSTSSSAASPDILNTTGRNPSKRAVVSIASPGTAAERPVRRVVQIDSDSGSSEYDALSDEEVLEIDPDKDDYVEIPRAKGEPPPQTMQLSQLSPEKLTNFRNLYLSQPKAVKELMKIYFYKGDPVVQPPPLASLIKRVKGYKMHRKAEETKKLEAFREKYCAATKGAQRSKSSVPPNTMGKTKTKEAKLNIVEVHKTDSQLVHVDFPARVENPDKAIQMMGGYNTINKVFNNVKKKLPVRFRPGDPFCNAAMGDPYPTVGILLRVRRRKLLTKPKKQPRRLDDEEPVLIDLEDDPREEMESVLVNGVRMTREDILREEKNLLKKSGKDMDSYMKRFCGKEVPEQYYIKIPVDYAPKIDKTVKVEALGIVSRTYKFNGICDFQYLPMANENGLLVSKRDCVLPLIGTPGENIDDLFVGDQIFSEDGKVERFLVPPMMSRVDKPLEAVVDHFLDSDQIKLAPELQRQKTSDIISTNRLKRNVYTMFHSFQADNSSAPVPQEPLPEALDDLSKRRLRGEALNRLKACFDTRPIWSRIAVEYETQLDDMTLKYALPCVAYFANNGPWRTLWIRLGYDPRTDQSTFLYQTVDYRVPFIYKQYIEEKEKSDDSTFRFRPNVIPPRAQAFYQLCDVKVDEVDRLVEIASKKVGTDLVYDLKYGWLKEGTFEYIRQVMNQYIELYLEDIGKIPEQPPCPKVFLKDGELEPSEKINFKRRIVKRFRKAKLKTTVNVEPKKPPQANPGSSKSNKSKKKVNLKLPSPVKPAHGTLQDLKIKDMDKEKELQEEEGSEEGEDFDFLLDDAYDDDEEVSGDEDEDDFGEASEGEEEFEKETEVEEKLKQEVSNAVGSNHGGEDEVL